MTPVAERILAHTITTPSGCMEWQGKINHRGYPEVWVANVKRRILATRVIAAELLGLELGDSKTFVCHHCDNPPCINPEHLFLGTALDNARDAASKGRVVSRGIGGWTDTCSRGHDMAKTRRPKSRNGSTECGACRDLRNAAKRDRLALRARRAAA